MILKGIAASPGIAIGRAYTITTESPTVDREVIAPADVAQEVERFHAAHQVTTDELRQAIATATTESATVASILESYLLIASDPVIIQAIVQRIQQGASAEAAVVDEFDVHKTFLYSARDQLLRERVQDFEHVVERIVAALRNRTLTHELRLDSIVVAGSITPHEMLFFKRMATLGVVTEVGGVTSHACILARDFELPAVIGIRNATEVIHDGDEIIVDGYTGLVVIRPDDATLQSYRARASERSHERAERLALVEAPSVTHDGEPVILRANIDSAADMQTARTIGCDGAGLVRTETMLVSFGRYPTADEQYAWYTTIVEQAGDAVVTFRAFDVGSDKYREGIPHHEENPALGLRGIRFLLYRPDIFEQQIEAILRAAVHGNVRCMLPMISSVEELEMARRIIDRTISSLARRGVPMNPHIPIGVMIETPAAALLAGTFAERVDFMSLGTNDLAQYTLATDRTNELVADIFDAMHPAVVQLIAVTVRAAQNAGIPVSICGELAGHAAATELLLGLGIRELSVAPSLALELKHRIRMADSVACAEAVKQVLTCTSTTDVYAILQTLQSNNHGGASL